MDHSVHKKLKGKAKDKAMPHGLYLIIESDSDGSSLFDTDDEEIPTIGVKAPLAAKSPHQKKSEDGGGVSSSSRGIPPKQYSLRKNTLSLS